MKKSKILFVIFFITFLGGFLRVYSLDKNPPSLNVDEVAVGYDAYSILKTARDQYGYFMPLSFKSLGDYKTPIYIYSVVPSIAFFGLNEFAIRLPSAVFGTLTIPLFFILFIELTSDEIVSLIGTTLVAISPWHIYHSRFAVETPLSLFFIVSGMILLLRCIRKGGVFKALVSSILFLASIYTYQTERIFTPMLIFITLYLNKDLLVRRKKEIILFFCIFVILGLLSFITLIGRNDFQINYLLNSRLFFLKDSEFLKLILISPATYNNSPIFLIRFFDGQTFLGIIYWLQRLLEYVNPTFLFGNGLEVTDTSKYGLGIMYLFEIPFFVLGLINLKKHRNKNLIILWLIFGVIPASLTLGSINTRRLLNLSPALILILAIGAKSLLEYLKNTRKMLIACVLALFIIWNLSNAVLIFAIHFPKERGELLMEGTKEALSYVFANQDKYQEVVFDPYRGVDGPYIRSVPEEYILFYSKYNPLIYQGLPKVVTADLYHFDKYSIRRIDWRTDRYKTNTLFVGSPWSFQAKEITSNLILKKIYLSNGNLALLIVSPGAIIK